MGGEHVSKPDRSIDPRLLEAAKAEFLRKGFTDASIREICASAGVTTGAFYKRYASKEELFDALVKPTVEDFKRETAAIAPEELEALRESGSVEAIWGNQRDSYRWLMAYMYDHYDVFRLLFCCAEGTNYDGFLHDLTAYSCRATLAVMGEVYQKGLCAYLPSEEELHMLMTAYHAALIEPIRHGYTREQAMHFCDSLDRLISWRGFFGC